MRHAASRNHLSMLGALPIAAAVAVTLSLIRVDAGATETGPGRFAGQDVALATPTNCQTGYAGGGDSGWAWCTGGTGDFRARVNCRHNEQPNTYFRYGPWLPAGPRASTSLASCNNGDLASRVTAEKRG